MASTHELILKLSGKMDSSLSSSLSSTISLAGKVNKKLNDLNKQKLNFSQYEKLNEKIGQTAGAFEKAKNALSPLAKEFNASKEKTEALRAEMARAENEVSRLSKAVAGSTNPTKEMRSALALAKIEAKEAKTAFKASNQETAELGRKHQSAQESVKTLTHNLERETAEFGKLKDAMAKAGISSDNFKQKQEQVSKALELSGNVAQSYGNMKSAWGDTKSKGRDFLASAAKATAAVAIPVKLAIDAENAMADIKKVTDFAGKDLVKFEQEMRKKIGTEIPMGFKDYADLVASAAQSGIKDSELLDFSKDAAKMSVAFDIEAGEAGKTMARWRTAFGMTQKEVVALADKVNYLSDNTSASAPEITTIVSKVGALSEVAGMTSGHVAALGASMVSMDVNTDVAGTAIKKMITSLTKGETATKGQEAVYRRLGTTSREVTKAMQKDAEGTILTILEGIKKLPKADQSSALSQLFGNESIQAIAPLLTQLDTLKTNFANVNEEAGKFKGSMATEFEIRSQTAENQLIMLKNNMESIGSTIGKALLPNLVILAQHVNKAAQDFLEWKNNNEETFNTILKVVGGIMALIVAAKGIMFITSAVKTVVMAFKFLVSVIKIAKFVIGILTGAIGGPLLAIMGAVLFAVFAWKTNFLGFRDLVTNIINWIKQKFEEFKTKIGEAGQKVIDLKNKAVEGFNNIGSKIAEAGNKIKGFFLAPLERAKEVIGGIKSRLSNLDLNPINAIKGAIQGFATGGIITRPQIAMVGEGGAHEAIIPLDGSSNARELWEYAGSRLGLLQRGADSLKMADLSKSLKGQKTGSTGGKNDIAINYNINITGGGGADVAAQIEEALRSSTPRLKQAIKQILSEIDNDYKRVSYAR